MQTTELDPTLSQTLDDARKAGLTLVIGNKNYSSWSMRPWVAMKAFGIPFTEVRVLLDKPDTANRIAEYSARRPGAGAGGRRNHDLGQPGDLRIPGRAVPRKAPVAAGRGRARDGALGHRRNALGLLRPAQRDVDEHPQAACRAQGRTPEAQGDIGRICEIWEECLSRFGHHQFLFGEFSIADAFYAPVVMRFRTYGVSLAPALQAYCDRVAAHPAVARWISEALAETETADKHDQDMPK